MGENLFKALLLSSIVIIISGCGATTPTSKVAKPWTRTLGNPQNIEQNSTIFLSVHGDEEQLLLDNPLLDKRIYKVLQSQLERRGYKISTDSSNVEYFFEVNFLSKEVQFIESEISSYQTSLQESYSSTSVGILAAMAVGAQSSNKSTSTRAETSRQTIYRNVVGFVIKDDNDNYLWTGESTWESVNANIYSLFPTVTQSLISNLPGYGAVIPRVPAVDPEKEENYYRIYIEGNKFIGPSLPYSINFERSYSQPGSTNDEIKIEGISDPRISYAVIDLIQTAEYAVPKNPEYEDPLSTRQWNKVFLGGKYFIGDDEQATNILVELEGSRSGYTISGAEAAEQNQYEDFTNRLSKWEDTLKEYYNVFE